MDIDKYQENLIVSSQRMCTFNMYGKEIYKLLEYREKDVTCALLLAKKLRQIALVPACLSLFIDMRLDLLEKEKKE